MKTKNVTMARMYITESSHLLKHIIDYLKKKAHIRGVSVFRAITGFGDTGIHTASLLDLSLDLPLIIEFFDSEDKVNQALEYLTTLVKSEHIVVWDAKTNLVEPSEL